jgi:arylsulfatase A
MMNLKLQGLIVLALMAVLNTQALGRQPNIILIMADDLGYECLGANGGTSYQTPVLDRLAQSGMRFEHCYAQPLCTPSRAKIMTGIYNVRNYVKFGLLDRSQTTFAHLLKQQGYATCIAGKWQLGKEVDSPQHFGFDASCLWQQTRGRTDRQERDTRFSNPWMDIDGKLIHYSNGEFGPDVASDFICNFMEENQDRPFVVYYPMILTHCPFIPTPDSEAWDPTDPGCKTYKGDPSFFGDMVSYMDKIVGKIATKLDRLGLRENTLILFTGDNGTDVPVVSEMNGRQVAGAKGSMTDAGTRVPLVANWPGMIPAGRVSNDLIDFSDFLPTLCAAAGTSVPSTLKIDGRSFLPQLKGQKGNARDWIYCWYSRGGGPSAKEWARNQRYKLYRTGKFYDVRKDVLEKTPLRLASLGKPARQAHAMLQKALDQYEDARPLKYRKTKKKDK